MVLIQQFFLLSSPSHPNTIYFCGGATRSLVLRTTGGPQLSSVFALRPSSDLVWTQACSVSAAVATVWEVPIWWSCLCSPVVGCGVSTLWWLEVEVGSVCFLRFGSESKSLVGTCPSYSLSSSDCCHLHQRPTACSFLMIFGPV